MARVYGYGRASTDKQALSESAQRHKVESHIRHNLSEHEYGGWLYDEDTSGRTPLTEREQGRNLWALVQPGDHIVWAKLDRAFRSVADGSTTLQMLSSKGVYVHSLDLGVDTSTAIGRFFCSVLLAFAELERECISDRTREGLAVKKREGRPYCTATPIGYRRYGSGKHAVWVPCRTERKQVQEIVGLRNEGYSLIEVAKVMRRLGTRPNGRYWNKNSIRLAVIAHAAGFPKHFSADLERGKASA